MRRILPTALALLVAASASGVVGFVYAHEPARDQQVVRLAPSGAPQIVSGTVTRLADGRITVEGEGGTLDLALPDGVSIEELQRSESGLVTGARVNVGVERSGFGSAVTGIVVVAGP